MQMNGDWFRNECLIEGSRAVFPSEMLWIFLFLKSPFWSFWVILKYLTDFRKTVETGMDPRLHLEGHQEQALREMPVQADEDETFNGSLCKESCGNPICITKQGIIVCYISVLTIVINDSYNYLKIQTRPAKPLSPLSIHHGSRTGTSPSGCAEDFPVRLITAKKLLFKKLKIKSSFWPIRSVLVRMTDFYGSL